MILAQTAGLTLQDIIDKLAPRPGFPGLFYDILLYIIFFAALITMFMQSDKQLITTLLMAAVAAMAVIAKLNVFAATDILGGRIQGTRGGILLPIVLLINAGMFVLPLIVAGITQAKKSRPSAVLGGIIGGLYFFAFWYISQRGG